MAEQNYNSWGSATMRIIVKTPTEQHVIEVINNASVREFRAKVAELFRQPEAHLCLVFAGKIMQDTETLTEYKLADGYVVHLAIKSSAFGQQDRSSHPVSIGTSSAAPSGGNAGWEGTAPSAPNPNAAGSLSGASGLPNLGSLGGCGFHQDKVVQRNNREVMTIFGTHPYLRSLMDNPTETIMALTTSPLFQQLMDGEPEIVQYSMELAKNPAAAQELRRNLDLELSKPGGLNDTLELMFRDVQRPVLNAVQERSAADSLAGWLAMANEAFQRGNPQQGVQNINPLPNPWAPTGNSTDSTNDDDSPMEE